MEYVFGAIALIILAGIVAQIITRRRKINDAAYTARLEHEMHANKVIAERSFAANKTTIGSHYVMFDDRNKTTG